MLCFAFFNVPSANVSSFVSCEALNVKANPTKKKKANEGSYDKILIRISEKFVCQDTVLGTI